MHPASKHRLRIVLALALAIAGSATAAEPALDPDAIAALDKMGTALRALPQFSLVSQARNEVVLDTGQKVELNGTITYRARRPDRLFVDVASDRRQRQLFYDGKTLTIYSPRLKYYAKAENVGKTLGELALTAANDYGIEFPLADLFFWGTENATTENIRSATFIGTGKLDGEKVDHYAFHQDDVDWQVWISQANSLPRRLLIVSLDDAAMPAFGADLKWDTKSKVDEKAFTFVPPAGAARLQLVAAVEETQEP